MSSFVPSSIQLTPSIRRHIQWLSLIDFIVDRRPGGHEVRLIFYSMKRSTGGASLGSSATGHPLTTSSAYVIGAETMRDLPAGAHPHLTSNFPDDHMDVRAGGKRPGRRGSGTKGGGGSSEGGSGKTKAGGGGTDRGGALESDPQSDQQLHWCLHSLHPNPELFTNGELSLPSDNSTSDSRRPQKDLSRIYFPWTLNAASACGSRLPPATSVVDPGHCVRYINAGQGQQRSRTGGHRCGRSGSGLSSPSSASNYSLDRNHPSSEQDDSRPGQPTHSCLSVDLFEHACAYVYVCLQTCMRVL